MKTDITILELSTFIGWIGVHVIFRPSMGQTQTQVDVLHFGVKETQHVFTVQSHYTGQHRQFTQNSLQNLGQGKKPLLFFCLLFYLSPKALDIVIFHITNNCMHVDMPSTKIDTTSSIFTRAWNAFNIMSPLKSWHLHIPDNQMVIIIHKASRNPWNVWSTGEGWPWPSPL